MSDNFHYAVTQTLEAEGLFSDTAGDPGGKTKYGVTEATWAAYCSETNIPHKGIKDISKQDAIAVYRRNYWDELHLDLISDKHVAAEIFDTAVNCGVVPATKIAQRACNLLNFAGEPLAEDGHLGPATRARINAVAGKYRLALIVCLNGCQFDYYVELGDQPRFKKFINGWMRRCVPILGTGDRA